MPGTNQYSNLLDILSKCLQAAPVPKIIKALEPLLPDQAKKKKKGAPSEQEWKDHFGVVLKNNLRGTKPEHLKRNKQRA